MSIATLKRKTAAKYKNVSCNTGQFSLNGTYRSQGYIGQTSLSHTFAEDHNDPTVIKPSVLSNRGRIVKRYPWILGGSSDKTGFEHIHVKANGTHYTQGMYIDSVANLSLIETNSCKDVVANYSDEMCHIVAVPSDTGALSYSNYLPQVVLSRVCNSELKMPTFPRNTGATPIDVCGGSA